MNNFVVGGVKGGDSNLVPPKETSKTSLLKLLRNCAIFVCIVPKISKKWQKVLDVQLERLDLQSFPLYLNTILLHSTLLSFPLFPSSSNLPHPLTQFSFHCCLSHLPLFTLSLLLNFHTLECPFAERYFHYLVVDHKMNILCWLEETVPEQALLDNINCGICWKSSNSLGLLTQLVFLKGIVHSLESQLESQQEV